MKQISKIVAFLLIVVLVGVLLPVLELAKAATLTSMSATLATVKKNTDSNQTILFTTSTGVAAGETITLTYDSDFVVNASLDYTDLDLSEDTTPDGVCDTGDSEKTLAASPSGSTWGAVRTSATLITFTSGTGTIAAGSEVCVEIGTNAENQSTGVRQVKNATTAASYNLTIDGTMVDTGIIVLTILDDDTVVTTATVLASLTFSISDNTIGFGNLSTSSSRWATGDLAGTSTAAVAHTLTAGTNSSTGYTVTVTGTTLTSTGTPGDTITAMASEATLTTGQEEFGLRITASGGSGTVDTVYDNTPANSYALVTAAFPDVIATSSTESSNTTYSLYYAANISSSTEAHTDYTSSLTYVATGNF